MTDEIEDYINYSESLKIKLFGVEIILVSYGW